MYTTNIKNKTEQYTRNLKMTYIRTSIDSIHVYNLFRYEMLGIANFDMLFWTNHIEYYEEKQIVQYQIGVDYQNWWMCGYKSEMIRQSIPW